MKEENKIKIKLLSILLVVMVLIPVLSSTALALSDADFDYMEKILGYTAFRQAGRAFPQPDAMFKLETSDGQTATTEPAEFIEADVLSKWETEGKSSGSKYIPTAEALNGVPVTLTVPVGTVIKLTDTSTPSTAGAKITHRDWQMFYTDHNVYWNEGSRANTSTVSWKADKEGYMYLFLSVADNYSPYRNGRFLNWNSTGNYRTFGRDYANWVTGKSNKIVSGNTKDWYFKMIKIQVGNKSEMVLREMELIDPTDGKVLESFKRNLDPVDPFGKQTIQATHLNLEGASILKKGKTYKVRAKYQYIDFSKGSFNISNTNNMTPEQRNLSTGVSPNTLDVKYAYDVKAGQQGQFDISAKSTSKDKPTTALKNLETAWFEWDYTVPKDKKAVKIAGIVPSTFPKSKNASDKDDWGTLYGMIEPADMGLKEPLVLKVDGKITNVPIPGKTHTVTVNGKYILGSTPLGLNHNNQPSGNNRFTISVSAREGSADGNYLKKDEVQKNA